MRGRKILTIISIYIFAGLAGLIFMPETGCAKKVLPKKITVSKKKVTLTAGNTYRISYKVKSKKTTNKKVRFSSSRKRVATVSKKGVVKAKKAGSTTITIRAKAKKSVKAKVKIKVAAKAPALARTALALLSPTRNTRGASLSSQSPTAIIMPQTLELEAGEKYQMNASLMPASATGTIVWKCDFQGGINVYPNGSIYVTDDTPAGTTATITATCGKAKATCVLTVSKGGCEHVWNSGSITTAGGCLTDSVRTYTCTKCNKTKTETIPAPGHEWAAGNVKKQPTCVENGLQEYICNKCGTTKEESIPVVGHIWVEGTITQEATCTSGGKKKYTCDTCKAEKTESIPAKGHTWDAGEVTKEPACTAAGTMTYHCTVEGCKGTKTASIPANGHTYNYGEVTTEPTCTAEGVRTSECLVCGKKLVVKLPKLGHDMDNGVVTTEPTCVKSGIRTYTCKRCKIQETKKIKALSHEYGEYVEDKAPTCTKPGEKSKYCKRCNKRTSIVSLPATGHEFDDGNITKQPKCLESGTREYTCKICKFVKKSTVAALGHDWEDDFTVDEKPDCRTSGKRSIHCKRCAVKKNVGSVKALGHDWGTGTVKKAPTCTEDGIQHYDCQRDGCAFEKEEFIPALGHTYSDDFILDVAQSCTEAGSESRHCTVCGIKSEQKKIPAAGHQWGAWSTVKAATCTESGMKKRRCTVCNVEEQTGIIARGHQRNSSGSCRVCGTSITYEQTTASDWNYTLDNTNKIITLRYYTGKKEYISIPEKMNVVSEGVTTAYTVAFKTCEGRETTGIFTSSAGKCDVKGVQFAAAMQLEAIPYLFYNCKSLEEVSNIPSTVKDMYATFKGCEKLVSVTGGLPDGITELKNTFENCSSLQAAPEIPDTVTNLYATFKNATGLTSAPEIPSGVTNMDWTFSGCSSLLMPPELPSVLTNMTNTFGDCTALQEVPVVIPSGVSRMTMTYYGCTSLKLAPSVPLTVKTMEYTYKNCTGLTYAAPILKTVEQIGVFDGCILLEE